MKSRKNMKVPTDVLTGVGLMSGTSIDGLDLIAVTFRKTANSIEYNIHESQTVTYSSMWRNRLLQAPELSALDMRKLDIDFSSWMAEQVNAFSAGKLWKADYVASHGHTIFHQPDQGFTFQIGCGATLAAKTGLTTVCDFRQGDVSLGGQGAPLVPIGDSILFHTYTYCLNLGGFANVSYEQEGQRIAYDISALNVVLNALARRLGAEFDDEGKVASSGIVISPLLDELNALEYYSRKAPKSLGTEWVDQNISPILTKYSPKETVADLLATFGIHFAQQIGKILHKPGKVLVTGGGARNVWLMKQIKLHSICTVELPEGNLIDSKESLIFSLLGYLRLNGIPSTLPTVTGAQRPIAAGAVYTA